MRQAVTRRGKNRAADDWERKAAHAFPTGLVLGKLLPHKINSRGVIFLPDVIFNATQMDMSFHCRSNSFLRLYASAEGGARGMTMAIGSKPRAGSRLCAVRQPPIVLSMSAVGRPNAR
ncbi:hypothetical protein ILFOPFJJ_06637 [Ensifer psoraleae]|uniref:hypothetical protein n=1 Tax=Sinorhizobium psoraleae TaxID=520838 RepID=UPI001568B813|nr:hypothetical protein [Sinorhizobium psoraleae]NRP75714.1 hypothetical protein [Sinorhizobium psoraleae]